MKRKFIKSLFLASLVAAFFVITSYVSESEANALPPFARKYKTSCTMCHSVYPKLNSFGRAFKRNGYMWPGGAGEENAAREQVKMAEGLGKGSIDQGSPFGALVEFEVKYDPDKTKAGAGQTAFDITAPAFELFWGGSSGNIGFLVIVVAGDGTFAFEAAQMQFNDLVKDVLNIKVGLLLGGAMAIDPQMYRAFMPTKPMTLGANYQGLTAGTDVKNWASAGIEINGVVADIVYYGLGVLSGVGTGVGDDNDQKDFYAFIEGKIGGMKMIGDATGSKFYEDNHALIRAFFLYQGVGTANLPADASASSMVLGANVEAWYSIMQFGTSFIYTMEDNGVAAAPQKNSTMTLTAEVGAFLMNGLFNPGVRFDYTGYSGDAIDPIAKPNPMWLHIGFSSMHSANVIHRVGARLRMYDDKVTPVKGKTLDVLEYQLMFAF